jgi:hypothetical protein
VKYFVAVFDTESASASTDEMTAITSFNAGLRTRGQLVMAVGLAHPSSTLTIDGPSGISHDASNVWESTVSQTTSAPVGGDDDNYLAGTGDFMSGFWVIDVASQDEAIELAQLAARACRRRLELRQILD